MCTVITLGSFLVITLLVFGAEAIGHRGRKSERTCLNLGPISNGRVIVYRAREKKRRPGVSVSHSSQFPAGTHLRYSCETGYKILGINKLVCEKSGFWNTDPPICVEECGRPVPAKRAIISDHPVYGEWPWVVPIFATKNGATRHICTGVLVDRRTVITAAHCVALSRNTVFTLYFGKLYIRDKKEEEGKVQKRTVTRTIPHPEFNLTTFDNDIAVLRFQPDIRYTKRIQPICLPTVQSSEESLVPGNKGFVTGWGRNKKSLSSDRLLMANIPVLPETECVEALAERGMPQSIRPSLFCARFGAAEKTDACLIQSGSPFAFYHLKTDRHTVQGIVSFGTQGKCSLPKRYIYFTKVIEYMPWIVEIIL